ncbi:cuticle protein AM1199-like [Oratosquilla oratoria]|uniref:cuticle protein AM1199-like n=1 Tax=Oratosquilla oratoria TaxID=337810 RepID=UPI003F7686F9
MMRLALFAFLVCTAVAQFNRFRPQFRQSGTHIPILRSESVGPNRDGSYAFSYESGDGTTREESGRPKAPDSFAVQGSYKFTDPQGTVVNLRYVADENGFHADSPFLPVAPPLPQHAIEQIRFAQQQRQRSPTFG